VTGAAGNNLLEERVRASPVCDKIGEKGAAAGGGKEMG